MRVPASATTDAAPLLSVLGERAGSADHLDTDDANALSTDVDVITVRKLAQVGEAEYWTGVSSAGDIALIITLPGGVSAVALASPDQFATHGPALSVSTPTESSDPVYLLPDSISTQASHGLEKLADNLYEEKPGAAVDSGSTTKLSADFVLVRLNPADIGG